MQHQVQDATKNLSEIQIAFKDTTVFLTGGTGFVGKLLLEKLLRSLHLKHIYMLVRPKKGVSIDDRMTNMFDSPMFDPIKRAGIDFKSKITFMTGDLIKRNLGLSTIDIDTIINEVNYIFHCAATVKFNEPLDIATKINVRATRDLLEIGKQVKELHAFIHVSSAYSNSNRLDIDEKFYEPPIDGHKLISVVESMKGQCLEGFTKDLLGEHFKNTYVLTKNVTESLVKGEGDKLPICVARPSIITSTAKEPLETFIDNVTGLSGMLLGMSLGVVRVMFLSKMAVDLIPGDFVINNIIVCGWYTGAKRCMIESDNVASNITAENNVPIFNIISTRDNPVNAYSLVYLFRLTKCYTVKAILRPNPIVTGNRFIYKILEFFLHTTTAYAADFVLWVMRKPTWIVKTYHKFQDLYKLTDYFYTTKFIFTNTNNRKLLDIMSKKDKQIFYSDLKTLDWEAYGLNYLKGLRVYLIKDPMDTIPESRKLMKRFKFYENCALAVFVLFVLFIVKMFI